MLPNPLFEKKRKTISGLNGDNGLQMSADSALFAVLAFVVLVWLLFRSGGGG